MTRRALAGAAAWAALLLAVPATSEAAPPDSGCFWVGPYASRPGSVGNEAFPDAGAIYWSARYTTPPGARLALEGRFAHARYQSLQSYDGSTAAPVDVLNDQATKADRGSRNPFKPGARRTVKRRAYTAYVSTASPPARGRRAPNTLYAGVAGQADQQLIYRVYLPDRGRDMTGGAGLPTPRLTLADGAVLRGSAACKALASSDNRLEGTRLPLATYLQLRDQPGKPPTFPAQDPPLFGAFYNISHTIDCVYRGVCDPRPARIGAQYSNLDVSYVGTFANRGFGEVLVLRGKLPTTPRTVAGQPRMRSAQLRYWSLCQNESLATTAGAGCIYDEQVPLSGKPRYVIVTSRPADRPRNARRRCGVGFVPWPAEGDGAGHPDDSLILVRNMLPAPGFHHAVQSTRVPGDEAEVMGPYLPKGEYTTTREFESRGCR